MPRRGTKVGQLLLASAGFLCAFTMWFATAAFAPAIMQDYHLTRANLAVLASSTMWLTPVLRQIIGLLVDRFGAPNMAMIVLLYTGAFSIISSFARNYTELFITRLIVATAGIFFVIGIQHVAQWFEEHEIGLAEGLYAGTGNAGAGLGAILLPRIYGLDYHTAFLHLGIIAIGLAIYYRLFGVAAASREAAEKAKKGATVKDTFYVMTRWAAIALMFHYAMSFGLEIGLNAWLPGYFRMAFEDQLNRLGYTSLKAITIAAGTLASVQSFNASLFRPFSGFISDLFLRYRLTPWPFLTKEDPNAPRIHWVFTSMVCITFMMVMFTLAGLSGNLVLTVATLAILGVTISFGTGSNFGLTPILFHKNPGIATGFIGGMCTIGGIVYPLIFGFMPNIHMGYAVVGLTIFIPIMLFFAVVFRRGKPVNVDAGIGSWHAFGLKEPLTT